MSGRDAREARTLGLWTASWLAVLLVAGLLWVGDLTLQWPVLLVPAVWAWVALRRRRPARGRVERPAPVRTDTVEHPYVQNRPERPRDRR